MTFTYPAVFRKLEDGTYEGYFPDLEGCLFHGDTLDDAINDAIAEEKEWITVELEEETGLPLISDGEDVELGENEFLRNVQVILHLQEGVDS